MDYVHSPEKQRQLQARTLRVIIVSQLLSGAGLAAGITVGALLAQEMLGAESYSGVPIALFTLGSAIAALLIGRLSEQYSRRVGLAAGFLAGGVGAVGIVLAAIWEHVPLLLVSLLIYGGGTATNMQARYASTDLALPAHRGRAVSLVMVFTTFGAVAGPNLVQLTGRFADSLGAPALSGPFMLAALTYTAAGLVLLGWLRPDPLLVSKAIDEEERRKGLLNEGKPSLAPAAPANVRGIIVGATVMVLTQVVMVAIMTMTPVHMQHHGHSLSEVGIVISLHIAAMFLPSPLTGLLVDKLGRSAMSYVSGFTLLLAGIFAAVVPGHSMLLMVLALVLLGLGWNMGFISGTAAMVDATTPQTRAKTQGKVDVLVALGGASGGALSGVVVAQSSFAALSMAGALLSLLLIPVVVWSRSQKK
nr:MFS transporter [Paenibacillus sp. YYML68]